MFTITEAMKQGYIKKVYAEMMRRGFHAEEIPLVIEKTPFMDVMKEFPEEQMHYAPYDAVNEILIAASRSNLNLAT